MFSAVSVPSTPWCSAVLVKVAYGGNHAPAGAPGSRSVAKMPYWLSGCAR